MPAAIRVTSSSVTASSASIVSSGEITSPNVTFWPAARPGTRPGGSRARPHPPAPRARHRPGGLKRHHHRAGRVRPPPLDLAVARAVGGQVLDDLEDPAVGLGALAR